MLNSEQIEKIREAFIRRCVENGLNANEALQYFQQKAFFEGWIE